MQQFYCCKCQCRWGKEIGILGKVTPRLCLRHENEEDTILPIFPQEQTSHLQDVMFRNRNRSEIPRQTGMFGT